MPHLYDRDGPIRERVWRPTFRLKPVTIWRVMPSQMFLRPIRSITIANIFEIEVNFNRISPEWE